ncbi:hypothetical protein [Halobacteriovorax sp. HLS]|uniref:hypothetical protein n=1 Tax=Halobacteriovorax sp. HLS TaxID=2234000 RepID=UPI000FD97547|nr:hypothetical protein [Halobacteriovorax sp. HLS]
MKVFSTFDNRPSTTDQVTSKRKKSSGPKKNTKSYRPPREQLSAEEIKARVAQKTKKSVAKVNIEKGKQVSTFMSDEAKPKVDISKRAQQAAKPEEAKAEAKVEGKVEEKKLLLQPDVDKNDPQDPNVRKKLKGLLSVGGFGWNEKERAALAEILEKD